MNSLTRYLFFYFFLSSALFAESGLERLIQGNARYVKDNLDHPNRTPERRESLVSKQEPFAVIVGCSDSRVPPEIIFDQGVGDLFVVRVAGNVVGPIERASIEYSVIYLHSSVILVLGHENCGAVDAVMKGITQDIEPVAQLIQPAVYEAKKKETSNALETTIKLNAIRMRDDLLSTPAIQKLVSDKKLEVYAGYYHLQSGVVEILKD